LSGSALKRNRASKRKAWIFPGSRLAFLIGGLALCAALAAGLIGLEVARRDDEQVLQLQHRLLHVAAAQLNKHAIDHDAPAAVAQSIGFAGLTFQAEPAANGRAQQPLLDADGRIAGFFIWNAPRSLHRFEQLGILLGGSFAALLLCMSASLWQLRRARKKLDRTEVQAKLAAEADKVTGLPNHDKMLEHLEEALQHRADVASVIFALLEIDGLADAAFGGEELTIAVAQRLREAMPAGAVCGRIGAAQFAVLFNAAPENAHAMVETVLDELARPYWMDKVVRLTAQAGYAQTPEHAGSRTEIARRAELALRSAAKKGPGSLIAFDSAIDRLSSEQRFVQQELPRALAASELDLHFQPIVAAAGGAVLGLEALLRWTHAEHGPIPPASFIPVAEQMGLMDSLGAFVLRRALQEAKRWPQLYMAVNLSPLQVRHSGIVDLVRNSLAEAGVSPARLTLEVTEGVLADNSEAMVHRIQALHRLGVRIALDDFGSGYSNLGYLQRFPFQKLKIDKSLVDPLGTSSNAGAVVQATVALGRALGLSITAEGVETEQQRVLLRLAGCDEMQGYLFSRPVPAKSIDQLLKRAQAPERALTA
jgi:predicted signal transduction protein with EAL and GGDEF domain